MEINHHRPVGMLTILSAILALGCLIAGFLAVEFDLDAFSDPTTLLRFAHRYEYAKWFALLDMLGYYLLLVPVIFYLHERLRRKTPWANMITFSGLSYVLIGAIGAVILAAVWPHQMQAYLSAGMEQRALLQTTFEAITWAVNDGLWNMLETILAGTWWVGVGVALRSDFKALGWTTILLGLSTLADSVGNMLSLKILAEVGLNLYLVLAIVWPFWIGTKIYRGKLQSIRRNTTNNNELQLLENQSAVSPY